MDYPSMTKAALLEEIKLLRKQKAELEMKNSLLFESERRWRIFSDVAFEGIALTENGIFIDMNDMFLNMTGYFREELIGKSVLPLVAPESQELVAESKRN